MKENFNWKIILIGIIILASFYYLYPTIQFALTSPEQIKEMTTQQLNKLKAKAIPLGLDLQGGMHMVLQVQTDEAVTSELLRMKSEVVELCKKNRDFKVKKSDVSIEGNEVLIKISDPAQLQAVKTEVSTELGDLNWRSKTIAEGVQELYFSIKDKQVTDIKERTFQQALETIRNRVDEFGVSEPSIQRQGLTGARIIIQLPGIEDIERAKAIIGRTAQLRFNLVKDSAPTREELLAAFDGKLPDDYIILRGNGRGDRGKWYYLLEKEARITGNDLENAFVGTDQYGMPGVDFVLKSTGGSKFRRLTSRNVGRDLAIVLDGQVQSAPRINGAIGKRGQITGTFSAEEAHDLALVLRAGALPASVVYLEERTVGPSLGRDSIRKGVYSAVIGLIIVLFFMVFYYRLSGLIADLALLVNIIILTASMAILHATLTLPGIAGIILTIGMAVDANVLIFERIREELKLGKTVRTSIAGGFSKAMLTIVDANVTTIIAAFVLLHFGAGPVRGFAVTLSFGIVASMFAALFVSRVVFDLIQSKSSIKKIKYFQLVSKTNIDFISKRILFMAISLLIISIGIISIVVKGGLNYGIDFAGGTLVQVKFEQPVRIDEVRDALNKINLGDSIIQKYGSEDEVLIRTIKRATDINDFRHAVLKQMKDEKVGTSLIFTTVGAHKIQIKTKNDKQMEILTKAINKLQIPDIKTEINERLIDVSFREISLDISKILKETFTKNPYEIRKVEMVGPKVGKELRTAALVAIIMALIGIVIYITIRFEFRFAIAAILALIHDVLITVGIFSLLNKEFNLPIIAALLTIVGYSLNDTIVVFDRLRENIKLMRKEKLLFLINISINQTLSRTLLTSLTTLFVVFCLFVFGGEVIHDFAFALLVGIIVGTYSSIYIASPFLILWKNIVGDKKKSRYSKSGKKRR